MLSEFHHLILNSPINLAESPNSECINWILEGNFQKVFASDVASGYLSSIREFLNGSLNEKEFVDFLESVTQELPFEKSLLVAIACLQAFVQHNWTGPSLDFQLYDLIESSTNDAKNQNAFWLNLLVIDGEQPYALTRQPELLVISLHILQSLDDKIAANDLSSRFNLLIDWWKARALWTHQRLLDNRTGTLYDGLVMNLDRAETVLKSNQDAHEFIPELQVKLNLSRGLIMSDYSQEKVALEYFQRANDQAGCEWEIVGRLGKRTRFQQKDCAQLTMLARRGNLRFGSPLEQDKRDKANGKPVSVDLNDDQLLEKIKWADEAASQDLQNTMLSPLEQCIVLAFCLNVKNTNPNHGLTAEQMRPYIQQVIEQPHHWLVYSFALLLRSRLESTKSRTVERAVLQIQALVDQYELIDLKEGGELGFRRLLYFWELPFPSRWEMQRELGEKFISLGVLKSALQLFERLEMWRECISCYQLLEQPEKARLLIDERMKKFPNDPLLHCYLGDVDRENAVTHYERAWELSNHRSSRAMKSLGHLAYSNEEYEKAVDYLGKAVAINSMFTREWFMLGCAAMQLENWERAQTAFLRCIQLDSTDGESWNNLAAVHLKCKRKKDALCCMKESLKSARDNWKIWENYFFLLLDVQDFMEALLAVERLLECEWGKKRERVDIEALQALIHGVLCSNGIEWLDDNILNKLASNDYESADEPTPVEVRIIERLHNILQQVHSKHQIPQIHRLHSLLHLHLHHHYCILRQDNQQILEAIEHAQHQYKSLYAKAGDCIGVDPESLQSVGDAALFLVRIYQLAGDKDSLYKARVLLRSLCKQSQDYLEDHEMHQELKSALNSL